MGKYHSCLCKSWANTWWGTPTSSGARRERALGVWERLRHPAVTSPSLRHGSPMAVGLNTEPDAKALYVLLHNSVENKSSAKSGIFWPHWITKNAEFHSFWFYTGYFLIFQYPTITGYVVVSLNVNYEYLRGFFCLFLYHCTWCYLFPRFFWHPTSGKAFH